MSTQALSPINIRRRGLQALAEALGPIGMARFIQQFETGVGDYTKEKQLWLEGMDVKTIVDEIKCKRKKR